ncbi:hypothetical protein [Sorangium sp. So ce117]|uniref:hypothetical protein n=1 Tax=Sorangium sp. So ce117 TaxID=3133277 RepID=UPI003F5F3711
MSAASARDTGADAATQDRPGSAHRRSLAGLRAGGTSVRAPWWLVAAAAALLSPWRAGAAPPRAAVQLEYRRAPGAERCPGEALLREEMARQLGYDPVEPEAAAQAKALVFRGPGREIHATMDLYDTDGSIAWSRHLVVYHDDCKELVMNMALSLRVALDPSLHVPPAAPPPPPSPAPPPPDAAAAAPAGRAWPDVRVGLAASAVFGTLQETTAGTALHVALRYPSFTLGVEGHVQLPVTIQLDEATSISTWLVAANVMPCSQRRHLFACAVASVGVVTTSSTDARIIDTSSLWLATGPRAGIEMPISDRLAIQFYGDIVLRLSEFRVESQEGVLWTPPAYGGLVGLRLDVNLDPRSEAPARRAALPRGAEAAH